MSDDNGRHPSDDLVPDPDEVVNLHQLDDETPDAFDEPMAEDYFENELPEEGVTAEDVAFEKDLESDLQEGATEDGDISDTGGELPEGEYAHHDTDYEQAVEDEEIERYGDEET
jgi:hypothetical protein